MSEILIFTLNGILIYLISDWIVRALQSYLGDQFLKYRQLAFFFVFLTLAMLSFQFLRNTLPTS